MPDAAENAPEGDEPVVGGVAARGIERARPGGAIRAGSRGGSRSASREGSLIGSAVLGERAERACGECGAGSLATGGAVRARASARRSGLESRWSSGLDSRWSSGLDSR